jgi:hypothetical protein
MVAFSNEFRTFNHLRWELGSITDYKRADLAFAACNRLNRFLRIVGDGTGVGTCENRPAQVSRFLGRLDSFIGVWTVRESRCLRNRLAASLTVLWFPRA